jgi:hypothetical protein
MTLVTRVLSVFLTGVSFADSIFPFPFAFGVPLTARPFVVVSTSGLSSFISLGGRPLFLLDAK